MVGSRITDTHYIDIGVRLTIARRTAACNHSPVNRDSTRRMPVPLSASRKLPLSGTAIYYSRTHAHIHTFSVRSAVAQAGVLS